MPISLPNAEQGKVVTRFPPEPSWMLDLGHCKASLLNQYIADQFQGKWILRFDDTNPNTCTADNVEAYMQDLPLLGLKPDKISYASDYFEDMISSATQLIHAGFLYADDTPTEQMRTQRMAKQASCQRERSVQDSLNAWALMQAGSEAGQQFCLRFKLKPGSENGAMRDPVAWRCIAAPHYRTGTRFKVYPTYDFAAPWLDLAEGVTHALRTLEFRDRDELYIAVQQAITKLHTQWKPSTIWEFPRIHMAYTPQLKVHQKALLSAGLVEGPRDPRLPTLRGLMRAGCHPDALKAFLLEQVTPARKETYHSWDKLWTLNRRLLDPSAARHMAVEDDGRVLVTLLNGPTTPQQTDVVWKQGHVVTVTQYKQIWIDQDDAQMLEAGDEVTLLAWCNATVQRIAYATDQQQQLLQSVTHQHARRDSAGGACCPVAHSHRSTDHQQQQQPPATKTLGALHHVLDQPERGHQKQAAACPPSNSSIMQPCSLSPRKCLQESTNHIAAQASAAALGVFSSTGLDRQCPKDASHAWQSVAAPGSADVPTDKEPTPAAVFERFRDVLALRDVLARGDKVAAGTSSCASTAGSASVAALTSLLPDVEENDDEACVTSSSTASQVGSIATMMQQCRQQRGREDSRPQVQLQHPQQHEQQGAAQQTQQRSCHSSLWGGKQRNADKHRQVSSITAVLNPAGSPKCSRFKLHWVPHLPEQLLSLKLVRFGHPVCVERVTEDVDVVACFNHNSRIDVRAWGDPSLTTSVQRGAVVQLQRKGLFIVDQVVPKLAAADTTGTQLRGGTLTAASRPTTGAAAVAADPIAIPMGSEAATAAAPAPAAAAEKEQGTKTTSTVGGAQSAANCQQQQMTEVHEVVLFYIPDGHTKYDVVF